MSVIGWGPAELGRIATLVSMQLAEALDESMHQEYFEEAIKALALISKTNIRAYNATYADRHGKAKAHTAGEIHENVPRLIDAAQVRDALDVIGLLRYNCVSNGGRDFAGKKTREAIALIEGYALRYTRSHLAI